MRLTSIEELDILMLVAGSDDPLQTGHEVRRRWRYLLAVARQAQTGQVIDQSLPQVVAHCDQFAARAEGILAALDEYLVYLAGNRKQAS